MTNPVPTVSSVSPTSATGNTAFSIIVLGTNFIPSSTIHFDAVGGSGHSLTTTYVSATQLTASVTTSQANQAGNYNVYVKNPAPGGGTSSSLTFNVIGNPIPSITSISPTQILIDTPLTLTINGTGFVSTSVIHFGSSTLATTYVSPTQVTGAVLATDLEQRLGAKNVHVTNPKPAGGNSNVKIFVVYGDLIKVVSSTLSYDLQLPIVGDNATDVVVIPANAAAYDLGAVLDGNDLNSIQVELERLVANGNLTVVSTAPQLTYNIEAAGSGQGLLNAVSALQADVASIQMQLASSIVADYLVDSTNLDAVNSSIGTDMDGNFTLPTFNAATYFQDALSSGPLNVSNYNDIVGTVPVSDPVLFENGALTMYDPTEGPNGILFNELQIINPGVYPAPAGWALSFNFIWNSPVPVDTYAGAPTYPILGYIGGDGHSFGAYQMLWQGVRDDSGNITQMSFEVANRFNADYFVTGAAFINQNFDISAHSYNSVSGATIPVKFVSQPGPDGNGLFSIYVGGQLLIQTSDLTPWSTSPAEDFTFLFGPGGFGGQIGWFPEHFAISNLLIGSPTVGTYAPSGSVQNLPFISTAPILKASVGWTADVPAMTSLTAQLSLDGGSHWVTVTNGELIDGTVSPWSSLGTSLIAKLSLASTDPASASTPVISSIVASSSKV